MNISNIEGKRLISYLEEYKALRVFLSTIRNAVNHLPKSGGY